MKEDFDFIKEKFKKNLKKCKAHLAFVEKIADFETKWTDSYMDFYPFDSLMVGYKPPKIYNEKPASKKTIFENRFKKNEIYYSFNCLHKEWGTEFYFTDEKNNKMRLFYENQNEDEKMLLSQLYYKIMNGKIVDRVCCYMYDPDMEEETFYIFKYFYDGETIKK